MTNVNQFLNIELILFIVMIVSGIIAAAIILQKFPAVTAIDIAKIPKEVDRRKKYALMENRLQRELVSRAKIVFVGLSFIVDRSGLLWKRAVELLTKMEQRYESQLKSAWKTQLSKEEQSARIRATISAADELAATEQYQEAEKKYIEAVSLDPTSAVAYKGLGKVYMGLKEYDHAKEVLKQAIKINKEDDEAYAQLATVETNLGNYDQAEADLLASIKVNTHLAGYHIDLGKVYAAKGEAWKAMNQYEKAVSIEPANPKYLSLLIESAIVIQKKNTAKRTLDALKAANPENQKISEYQTAIDSMKKTKT